MRTAKNAIVVAVALATAAVGAEPVLVPAPRHMTVGKGVYADKADLVVWDGLSMSAWTNTQARWKNPCVTEEGLAVEAVAHDPQLYAKPSVSFIAQGNQYVEITVRSSQTGEHQLYWCSEKGGGCTRERHVSFRVDKAGEWEMHKVHPEWFGEGRITRLRI